MRNNDQSNRLIKWIVTVGDFCLLNAILLGFAHWHWRMGTWQTGRVEIFILVNNIALMLAMLKFSTIIHLRVIGAGEILKRMVGMTVVQTVLAYLLLKVFAYNTPIGWLLLKIGTVFFFGLLFPIIYLIIKIQSPGPIFFKQLRTGLDGRDFYCYKFRSMHVNKDADRLQATKDAPRKYPFGNFMRKANIDELPQFWNVLKGDMSIVGPRPHMLLKIKWIDPVRGLFKNTSRPVSKIRKRA